MAAGDHVMQSLELVSARHGDPMRAIYQTMFDAYPELEDLFALDDDWSVRGSMLYHAFECIEDHFGAGRIAQSFIASSRIVHDGYGVPSAQFDAFFIAMRDTFKVMLGDDWSKGMDQEWQDMLAEFAAAH